MPHLSPSVRTANLLFLSGQIAFEEDNTLSSDMDRQTRIILDRLQAELARHRLGWPNVVKANVWLADAADFGVFDSRFAATLGAHRPARSTVISALAIPGAKIEIDLIASFDAVETA